MATALIGDRVRFSFTFRALGTDALTTPAQVTVLHRHVDGTETEYTLSDDPTVVIEDTEGQLHADIRILPNLSGRYHGRHYFRAIGTGTPLVEKSTEEYVDVPESAFNAPLPNP